MDTKLFWTTFLTLFIAEMGDKTQLAAFSLSAKHGKPWTVFVAGAIALSCVTLIGAFAGKFVGKFLPEQIVKYVAGGLFIAVGIWTLLKKD